MGAYGSIGLSFTALTMDEMMVRTVQDPEPDEYGQKFDAGNISMGISYAKRLTDRFSFGFQTKFIQESIWQMKAQGYAVDIGTMFVTKSNLNIGMSISNFGGKLGMQGVNTLVDIDIDLSNYNIKIYDPQIRISTKNAFDKILPNIDNEGLILKHMNKPIKIWKNFIHNDFELLHDCDSKIAKIKQQAYDDGAIYVSMTGTGSAVYAFFEKI